MKRYIFVILLGAAMIMSGGSAVRAAQADDTNDPLESMNRTFFDLDLFLDRILLKPATQVYVAFVPGPGRHAVHNVLTNMNEPIVFANNMLQGEFHRADVTVGRFLLNSTFGLAGIFDWASVSGLPKQNGDFGQTLYVWGFPSGPYLFLPLLGPTNPRDTIGYGVDSYADPVGYAFWNAGGLRWMSFTRFGSDTVDSRSQQLDTLDQLQKTSIDFYATIRSLSRQRRAIELRHGEAPPLPQLESMKHEPQATNQTKPVAATP